MGSVSAAGWRSRLWWIAPRGEAGRVSVVSENRETAAPAGRMITDVELDDDARYRALSTRDARFDGRFFVGVHTTGIYCRPICPARTPRRENVSFHASAAAAQEAGFRPCLRCRPDVSPQRAHWQGTASSVARGLGLIEDGALDTGDVAELSERLGLGERQLRRLFQQHLGASPVAVAQTRRVLLAKQLIHDTRLPMTEVALAAGFGSVRRFNETFQRLYRRPPSALRRGSAGESPTLPGGELQVRLPFREPYDWPAMLAFLAGRAIPGVERVDATGYARSFDLQGRHGSLRVSRDGGANLRVTLRFAEPSALAALPGVLARVRRLFDLDADPFSIEAGLSADPLLAPLLAARPGLRVPGAWDGLELAVRAILGQQISVGAARGLAGRLVAEHGEPMYDTCSSEPELTHRFPLADVLARADLSTLPMPRARSRALVAVAEAIARDPSLVARVYPLDEAVSRWRALPGVGEWTAQYIAMRQLREPDAFPTGDAALLRAHARLSGQPTTHAELSRAAERWRPWRAYAAVHLWTSHAKEHA